MNSEPTANILVVDDDLRTLTAMEALLSGPGRNVVTASSGTEALRRLLRDDFALILMDVRLPEMDGFETAALIRQRERFRFTPIIFISAIDTLESDVYRGAASGAVDYLFKPVVPQVLQAKVAVFVDLFRMNELLKQRAVRQTEERFRLVVESLQDYAVFTMDPNGRVSTWNRGAERIGGWQQHEVIGQFFETFYTSEDREKGLPALALNEAAAVGRFEEEGWRMRKDGSRFWGNVIVTALLDDGALVGYSAVIRDLTERKRTEEELKALNAELKEQFAEKAAELFKSVTERDKLHEQLLQAQKMESLGTLAGGIAHDMNNLLNLIAGYASSALENNADPEKLNGDIEVIQETVRRGASLVQQLLAMGRKTETKFERVQVNDVLLKLEPVLRETFPRTIDVVCDLEAEVQPIMADHNQIHQTIFNLCLNARDAMPNGGTLAIKTSAADGAELRRVFPAGNHAYIVMTVTDTGIGMHETTKSRIFEPFFTTKALGEGTGLGMAVVYGIVTNHKGFIDVESQPGRGTTVRVFLPVPQDQAAVAAAKPQITDKQQAAFCGHGETILFVEDEIRQLQLMQRVLERNGYRILPADDGAKALEIFTAHNSEIALVILDLGLPKLNGWEAYRKMKEINPGLKAIFATGFMSPELLSQLSHFEHSEVLFKPYQLAEVLAKVFNALKGSAGDGTGAVSEAGPNSFTTPGKNLS